MNEYVWEAIKSYIETYTALNKAMNLPGTVTDVKISDIVTMDKSTYVTSLQAQLKNISDNVLLEIRKQRSDDLPEEP